jgi:hypothetical protein
VPALDGPMLAAAPRQVIHLADALYLIDAVTGSVGLVLTALLLVGA